MNYYRQNNKDISTYSDDELILHWVKHGYYEERKLHN